MNNAPFKKIHFLTSALKSNERPKLNLPEIAIVGRSNVGKSSLINHLFRSKTVAKTSSKPGKTQRINYFVVDDLFLLVDLPGYGYAKTSKKIKHEWGFWIDQYLKESQHHLLLFLLDSRRELTEEDREFIRWAKYQKKQLMVLFTKKDKLSQPMIHALQKRVELDKDLSGFSSLLYSVKEGKCREALIHELNRALWD